MHSFFKTMFCLFLASTASIIVCSEARPKKLSPCDAQLLNTKKSQEFIAFMAEIKQRRQEIIEKQRQKIWCAKLKSYNSSANLYDSEPDDREPDDSDSDDEITGFFRKVDPSVFAQPIDPIPSGRTTNSRRFFGAQKTKE